MAHKTKVNPQNRQYAGPLLTSVIIDRVDVEWGVIQRFYDAEKGLQDPQLFLTNILAGEGQNSNNEKEENLTTDR